MVRWEAKRIKRALQSHVNLLYRAIFHESFPVDVVLPSA